MYVRTKLLDNVDPPLVAIFVLFAKIHTEHIAVVVKARTNALQGRHVHILIRPLFI